MKFREILEKEGRLNEGDTIYYKQYSVLVVDGNMSVSIWSCFTKDQANQIAKMLEKQVIAEGDFKRITPKIRVDSDKRAWFGSMDELMKVEKMVPGKIELL
jgi:hypothetical protein